MTETKKIEDPLTSYGLNSASRLRFRTARYDSPSLLADAICAADPAMLTVSVRRQLSGSKDSGQSFWNLLRDTRRPLLPNTAGCPSSREAIKTACMARELFRTDFRSTRYRYFLNGHWPAQKSAAPRPDSLRKGARHSNWVKRT